MNRVLAERMIEALNNGQSIVEVLRRVAATEEQETIVKMYKVANGDNLEQIRTSLICFFQEEIIKWKKEVAKKVVTRSTSPLTQQQIDENFRTHNNSNRIHQENVQINIDNAIRNHNHN